MGRSVVSRAGPWLDDHRYAGYLLIAASSGVAIAGTSILLNGEQLSQAAISGLVWFVVAFLALLGWSYLFRRAGVDL